MFERSEQEDFPLGRRRQFVLQSMTWMLVFLVVGGFIIALASEKTHVVQPGRSLQASPPHHGADTMPVADLRLRGSLGDR